MKNEEYVVLYAYGNGPSLTLLRGGGHKMFAKLIDPQPKDLPADLVLIEVPPNCYIDVQAAELLLKRGD